MAANASSASVASMNSEKPFLTTTFPSSLPTPQPMSPSEPIPPSAFPARLHNARILLSQGDRTASRLAAILSTPSGQDTVLATASYTFALVHANVNALLSKLLQGLASDIARNASGKLLPGETVIATLPLPKLVALLVSASTSSKALANLISDYRIFVRLWGLLGIWGWAKRTYAAPPEDRVLKRVAWAQVGVNVVYQGLENVAYLAQHGIVRRDEKRVARDWKWSSRFWMAHVGLEFVRLYRLRALSATQGQEKSGKEDLEKRSKAAEAWWRDAFINACYAPMTIHWSLETGYLSDSTIALLGTLAGTARLRQMWKETA